MGERIIWNAFRLPSFELLTKIYKRANQKKRNRVFIRITTGGNWIRPGDEWRRAGGNIMEIPHSSFASPGARVPSQYIRNEINPPARIAPRAEENEIAPMRK